MELFKGSQVEEVLKLSHKSPINPPVVFVFSPINHIKIAAQKPGAGPNEPKITQFCKKRRLAFVRAWAIHRSHPPRRAASDQIKTGRDREELNQGGNSKPGRRKPG
jgi:hypothetical protein